MKRIVSLLVAIPVGIAIIVLAVANRHPVTLSVDPFAPETPAISVTLPFFVFLFAAVFVGLLLGGFGAWLKQGHWRREARDRRYEAARWRNEADRLKESVTKAKGPALPAPGDRHAA